MYVSLCTYSIRILNFIFYPHSGQLRRENEFLISNSFYIGDILRYKVFVASIQRYIVTQKLPKELESTRKAVKGLQQVTGQAALGQESRKFKSK